MESETNAVEVTESAKEKAAEMRRSYDDRPTAVLPGSHNTVTGTAVNDWLDEDGNPKFGKDQQAEDEKGSAPTGSDSSAS